MQSTHVLEYALAVLSQCHLGSLRRKNDHFFEWTHININVCMFVCQLYGLYQHGKSTDHDHLGAEDQGTFKRLYGPSHLGTVFLKSHYLLLLLLCEQVVNTYTPGKKIWLEGVVTTSAGGTNNLSDSYAAGFL